MGISQLPSDGAPIELLLGEVSSMPAEVGGGMGGVSIGREPRAAPEMAAEVQSPHGAVHMLTKPA